MRYSVLYGAATTGKALLLGFVFWLRRQEEAAPDAGMATRWLHRQKFDAQVIGARISMAAGLWTSRVAIR